MEREGEGETAAAFGRRKEEERVCVCGGGGAVLSRPVPKALSLFEGEAGGEGEGMRFSLPFFFFARRLISSPFLLFSASPVWLRDFSGRGESESGNGEVLRPWEYWVYKNCKVSKVGQKKSINDMQNGEECSPSRTFGVTLN